MLEGIAIAVISALIVAAILAGVRFLRVAENCAWLRQHLCRHDWHEIEPLIGSNIVFVNTRTKRCERCGAER